MKKTLLYDAHTHISSDHFIPDKFLLGVADNIRAKIIAQGVPCETKDILQNIKSSSQDHNCDEMIQNMNECDISKSILLLPDFTYWAESNINIKDMYLEHKRVVESHPGRFHVFCGIDPRHENALELFKFGIENCGFSGLKLYPPCGYSPSDKSLFPIYEYCESKSLPVLLHTGPTSPTMNFKYSNPYLIDEAARAFKGVNFILAHGGVFNIKSCVELCAYRHNIFLDIAGFPGILDSKGWGNSINSLLNLGINHKIIFGTDWPIIKYPGGHKKLINEFHNILSTIPKRDSEMIGNKNIFRITPSMQ